MSMRESEVAETRAVVQAASQGDTVDVTYRTSHGNKKTKRGEVRNAKFSELTIAFPDGKRWDIVGTGLRDNSHNRLLKLQLREEYDGPELVHILRGHSRVDSVERDGDEWVAYIEGNPPPIRNIIERYGGEVTERAKSPWNPEEDDPRPMRFRIDGS